MGRKNILAAVGTPNSKSIHRMIQRAMWTNKITLQNVFVWLPDVFGGIGFHFHVYLNQAINEPPFAAGTKT